MEIIRQKLQSAIRDLYSLEASPDITPAPGNISADYSSNIALKLAKELHKAPMDIAGEMASYLTADNNMSFQNSPEPLLVNVSSPGFLNITVPAAFLTSQISSLAADFTGNISSSEYSGQTIICEFSDPNPFKVLHVGHLYTSIVGDAISRLFAHAGAKVIRANFGGDVGLHVAKALYILQQRDTHDFTIEDIAECYVEGTAAYDDDAQAHAAITELNKEIYRINSDNLHDSPLAELYWRGRELSYDYFKHFYADIGVHFDKYYPESSVTALGLATIKEQLAQGVYELSDGAVIFDGDKYSLHTRVFINKEGIPTYEAKDVGLIFTKWQDYHFDKSVVITGNEQLDYMKVVLKSVEQYAPELVARTTHLTHGLVKLPGNVKMSSRKGNFLKAVDVLNMVQSELQSAYSSSDTVVALAATKYAFLRYKMGGNIVFDPKDSVKMTGNSGPYLLYSAVRAKKILQKCSTTQPAAAEVYDSHEKPLAKKLLEYKSVLQDAVAEMAPHKVANYLYELAQEFSRFYEHCPVAGSAREGFRAQLVRVYLATITHGLDILGISIPEEM